MDRSALSAQAWLDAHEHQVLELASADAVELVELAGLEARVLPYGPNWMTQDLRANRVNLWLSEDGTVRHVTTD
jgi:hypothetical protein